MIWQRHKATPRHLQKELGPSEVSHPCMRKMAFGIMDVPRCNPEFDPLPSIIGVATHKWLESAGMYANTVLNRRRWLTETRVNVAPGLSGSCDLFDTDTGTVIDFKVPGDSAFDKYRKDPGPTYKGQVFLYGKGFENAGLTVKQVAIAFLPRGRTLRSLHIWRENYDRSIAEAICHKREIVLSLINDLEVEKFPERYAWIPSTPYDCIWCPWFSPNPKTGIECRGDQ